MKSFKNRLVIPLLSVLLCFAFIQVETATAQLTGGAGQASSLEGSVSGTLSGKVGKGVFEKLSKPISRKRKPRRKSAAVKSTTSKRTGRTTTRTRGKTPSSKKAVEYDDDEFDDEDYEVLSYVPIASLNTAQKLASAFSQDPNERLFMLELFKVVKSTYDVEAAKKGKKNDVALALTFFIASNVTVYNDAPEPGDPAFDDLYEKLAAALIEDDDFVNTSDRMKQEMSESLIYITGIILGGYMNAKQADDANSLLVFRQVAGISLKSLTQIDADRMSFDKNGLVIKP